MLPKDEARRIAVNVTRLPEPLGKAAGTARCLGALVAADNAAVRIVRASLRAAGPSRAISTEDCNAVRKYE
jgi:hypothetical protein